MDNRDEWRERVKEIRANGTPWWYIHKSKKMATVIEGDQKAPFSIATTPRCRGGCYSFPWIYIYIVLFGPVKPELGVIPSGQENLSGAEHLNFPSRELKKENK